jgi:hypothetical protein
MTLQGALSFPASTTPGPFMGLLLLLGAIVAVAVDHVNRKGVGRALAAMGGCRTLCLLARSPERTHLCSAVLALH